MLDALAEPLERVEFEGASHPLIPGDRIQGYPAKPEGVGPFPAVIGLHGCAGMPDTTKRKLADDLVAWGYVVLLVDSFATRGIDQACTYSGFSAISRKRVSDAYGALAYLAGQTFVDRQRVAAVGFSQGGWVTLSAAEVNSFKLFGRPSNLRFRAAVAFYPVCRAAGARPAIPTLIVIGALDEWTPAADCSDKIDGWGIDGVPIEQVVYPGSPWILLPGTPARQDHIWSLGGIQWRGSEQCAHPDAAVSRSPPQPRACQQPLRLRSACLLLDLQN